VTALRQVMRQTAPYPEVLARLVAQLRYRPGWIFQLADIVRDPEDTHQGEAAGLTFTVITKGFDSYNVEQGETYRVSHHFPVPAATYNAASWCRWLFDCLLRVETHEAMEFFQVGDERPYAPTHGPGDDPYVVHDYATDTQRRTQFTGTVNAT
jgi:hypothetical protein